MRLKAQVLKSQTENRDIHQSIPDHRVKLTPEGWTQAHDAGRRLRSLLRADDTLHFFTSPYRRTRETTEGILSTLTSDESSPSPFVKSAIKVYEEPRLREQDFGNFQPCSAEMERMWQERADYGHFFYRIPNGESAADAYDRISGFNESLWRQFGEQDFASVCVLVTHGLMSRVFLMKWYHFSVEYFEDLRNINHCEFVIMRQQEGSGKYLLENNLRTWSELKRERAAAAKEKEKDKSAEKIVENALSPIPQRKQWGGCPNGCNHGERRHKKEGSLHAKQHKGTGTQTTEPFPSRRPAHRRWQSSSDEDLDDPRGRTGAPMANMRKSIDSPVAAAGGTHSQLSAEDDLRHKTRLAKHISRAGRDFGGSASGHTSQAGSDTEGSADETARNAARQRHPPPHEGTHDWSERSGMGRGAKANALGDQSVGSDKVPDDEALAQQEKFDKSVEGSVY
ncbi:MAG: hypothetical protein M1818_000694 [Claussenomyces sp. TS43310]|nr:MAG: hypothetical protein M1818_000694 [Claussenomyces sp. TS43310]